MESILSVQEEIYPIKARRTKSSSHLSSNNAQLKSESFHQPTPTGTLVLYYHSLKAMLAERALYILGVLNLVLAAVAIVCVTQAEDHPEYFSLVYIAVSVFVFYMGTIVFIIVLQIVETYQEQATNRQSSSVAVSRPTITTPVLIHSTPMIVESMTSTTQPKTRLSRSQTLPLTSRFHHSQQAASLSTSSSSSSTLKEHHSASPIQSIRLALLPKSPPPSAHRPRNYQAFALRTDSSLDGSRTLLSHSGVDGRASPLIKPIPMSQPSPSYYQR